MSLFLFLNTSLKTLAAGILPSAQIYPVLQGANLILSGLMAHFLFKEVKPLRNYVSCVSWKRAGSKLNELEAIGPTIFRVKNTKTCELEFISNSEHKMHTF